VLYLRGLSSFRGWGHGHPGKFLENGTRRLNLGAFEAKI